MFFEVARRLAALSRHTGPALLLLHGGRLSRELRPVIGSGAAARLNELRGIGGVGIVAGRTGLVPGQDMGPSLLFREALSVTGEAQRGDVLLQEVSVLGRVRAVAAGAAEQHRAVDRGLHERLPVMTTVAEVAHLGGKTLRIPVGDLVRNVRRVNGSMTGSAAHGNSRVDALARCERLMA